MSVKNASQTFDEIYAAQKEASEREDLVMFINACFAATGQTEYYCSERCGRVSIAFLHSYVLANYRTVYRRVLAAGVNDFNRARIVTKLLGAGAPTDRGDRLEEGRLISRTLRSLPANRVLALFVRLRESKINNRRTRAVVRDYLRWRSNPTFDAVKYRRKLRIVARHAHVRLDGETGQFLFALKDQKRFDTPLYDAFLRAHYAKQAVFELPYTVAEGFAARHEIPRDEFMRKIEPQMTHAEKQRVQASAGRRGMVKPDVDLARTPLTRLAMYVASLSMKERRHQATQLHESLRASAASALRKRPVQLGKVALVLDRSRSTWGSREKRRRPLAVAIAIHYLVGESASEMRAFWTPARSNSLETITIDDHAFLVEAGGQTDLATPLLLAIEWRPDNIIIVSDGYENAPPDAASQIVHAYRKRFLQSHAIAFMSAMMSTALCDCEYRSERVYRFKPFSLERFITDLDPAAENHIGEAIYADDGSLQYLKTYRMSSSQTRRAFLLSQLADHEWNLDQCATALGCRKNELILRLENAGFGYLLHQHVLDGARAKESRRLKK